MSLSNFQNPWDTSCVIAHFTPSQEKLNDISVNI